MSNRSSGEGTISKRKDGRWQASLQVGGVRHTVYGKTQREARNKLRDLQRQADKTGSLPTPGKRTVNDLLDAWLNNAPNLKPSTIARYRWFLDTGARPEIGELRIDRVTPDRLQNLYAHLTPSVSEKLHRILHRAFEIAVLWRWLDTNPCDRVLKPAYNTPQKTLWNSAELVTFLNGTENHWLNPLWTLLVGTGCRLGEVLALDWEDIGWENKSLTVRRTLNRIDGAWVLDVAKTNSSVRTITLPDFSANALQRQKQLQDSWKEAIGSEWEEWNLVFTGETGKPLFASTIQHALKRECNRLNLPIVTPHSLRHLHASLLLDEGVPIPAVSARLGHANPQVTMKIYAHALPGQDKLAADAIRKAMNNGKGTRDD